MDWFIITLCVLSSILVLGGIVVIVLYLRFQERSQRLPEACEFIDLDSRNKKLVRENNMLETANRELEQISREATEKKAWLEENGPMLLSMEADRKKQEELKSEYEGTLDKYSMLIPQVQEESKKHLELEKNIALKNTELQKVQKDFFDISSKKNDLELENSALLAENQKKTESLQSMQNSFNEIQEAARAESDRISKLREEYYRLQQQNDQLAKEYAEVNALSGKIKAESVVIQQQNHDLEEKSKNLTEQLDSMKHEKSELEARNAFLLKENETKTIDIDAAERKLRELQETIGAADDKLQNITAEYTAKQAELDSFQVKKDALQKEIDYLTQSLDSIRKESGAPTSNEDTLKDLWEPIVFPALKPAAKPKNELDLLAEAKEYIRGKKLYFPDRVIHAFHTAMKCNDISPITVLAGISGTGKSELPKCYAEGMGMHFAMLAVQPRWDSPQDLLGFYNYMENKYKATELARAMVRFDMYNRSSWGDIPAECDDRSDRMLLILLDEMNLARVEYYFSEFLSKLETRRGVNLENDVERVKAEIELELTGRAPLRIFPGRNILFTGTMNEDESTQTLSDKVLDRANVLRFGKPKSSNIADKIRNSQEKLPRDCGLTYANWQSWCTDSKNVKIDSTVSEWIDRLNSAMESLQKPFGHRVAQAIAAYIANYPKGLLEGGREKGLAFADQIEQRIMPKLRGIDLDIYSNELKKIGNLIDETQDAALSNAFAKSCSDNGNGIFMWQGIDRSEDA